MNAISLEIFGLMAGLVTSAGFIPQLIRGYRTKKLDDISYFMPIVLTIGLTLWFIYGYLMGALAIMVANAFGVGCCLTLVTMKKKYSQY